jgi:predicted signal transduction protein with EAL and GGDEF domain
MPASPTAPQREALQEAAGPPATPEEWSEWQRERLGAIEASFAGLRVLPRQAVLDALAAAIRESVAGGAPGALLLVDLNGFADINAAHGPAAGDAVLVATAERLRSFLTGRSEAGGAAPAVGRLDADHFAVIFQDAPPAERLRALAAEMLRHLGEPVRIDGEAIRVGARGALIHLPAHARSVTTALGRGFRLLNNAARASRDGLAVSDASLADADAAMTIERDLAAALSTDELFIVLQPKVETATRAVRGAEALVRWRHPERGLLPPLSFIGAAEKGGLIYDLGFRILRDACRASRTLSTRGRPLPIAVNVSPHQLGRPDFLSRFLEIVDREGTAPGAIEIEVTETVAMMGGEDIRDSLKALRRCGIAVAIDDFGTGFSNLASLATLPADTLKIDRSLVIGESERAVALLAIAAQLARIFALKTVAEGVETEKQLAQVKSLGIDYVQGFLTGAPVDVAAFKDAYVGG